MKSNKILSFLMLFSISFSYSINAEPIPLEKLLCGGNSSAGTLSPSGRYYAAMVPSSSPECEISEEDEKKDPIVDVLIVIDLEDGMKAKRLSGTNLNARVGGFRWLNDETLSISRSFDSQMGDKFNPDLYLLLLTYSKYASSITSKMLLLSFFLKFKISFLFIYVPVGLFGLAKNTILVFLVTLDRIFETETVKLFSFAFKTLASFILLYIL